MMIRTASAVVRRLSGPLPFVACSLAAILTLGCDPKKYDFVSPPQLIRSPSGIISGRVTLNGTTPIAGMTVQVEGRTTMTDSEGRYEFRDLAPRNYVVRLPSIPPGLICNPDSREVTVERYQTTTADFDCRQSDFLINTQFTFVHAGTNLSYVCISGTVIESAFRVSEPVPLAALTGATWSVSWAGPGVVGATQRTGTLDATGRLLDRQQINRFGTYTATLTVTANGVTKQATGEVTVGAAQGTCTPP